MSHKIIVLGFALVSTLSLIAYSSASARNNNPIVIKTPNNPLPLLEPTTVLTLTQSQKLDPIQKIKKLKPVETRPEETEATAPSRQTSLVHTVPFYSQFTDITKTNWQKVGCGIASLGMLIDYYKPAVNIDTLLDEGISAGAYIDSAGWSHAGLINLAEKYGLTGASHSLAHLSMKDALSTLEEVLEKRPVMVSVHYTFEPTNPIPHLVVVSGIKDGHVYYNDPAEPNGNDHITIKKFQNSWKRRYIEIYPS